MRRLTLMVVLGLVATMAAAGPAGAITFGQPDGNRHPNVGALLADFDQESPGPELLCTGTLIASDVFLTAGHCTAFLEAEGIERVWVTFRPQYDEDAAAPGGLFAGRYVTHPDFGFSGPGGFSDPHDMAVVLLNRSPGIAPAKLPPLGLLDRLKSRHQLKDQTFTAVGYGTVREDKTGGPHAFFFDGIRHYALQSYLSLQPAWLVLSMQPSTGDGGTCYGDSGGPHFLGGVRSNLIVSTTVTGDAMCRATDKTYRLDTRPARAFLDNFVALP
ncbi:MAG: S1 family peptidase [Actinomycetota bacterium]|nr:S1 family peptidase [Actinomycetota bacterium]